ncbi:hypothetical protein A0256_07425 [Mucilaginibacter sp. PAMC 26640]|nr:hypothetical protein A0256_07425 [Mucilaginibacter sp. PAMC 26640]
MKKTKDELQNIIFGDGPVGEDSQLKKAQTFLRRYAQTSVSSETSKQFKYQEAAALLAFAEKEGLYYTLPVITANFLGEGAEQKVYRYDDATVLKTNQRIFYETWLDYFNSLLIHNYFFKTTAYHFIGFQIIDDVLQAIVQQEFIISDEVVNQEQLKNFLIYNGFKHTRNNDYSHPEIGLILEDLHDENVLSYHGILYFIDTVFYLTPKFFH